MGIVERVKGVKELFLRSIFSLQKLNVINKQQVDAAIFFLKFVRYTVLNSINQFICEVFGGYIDHGFEACVLQHLVANGVHNVGFAKTHSTVNEQRVVCFGRRLGHSFGCGMGELVAFANDE